MHAIFMIYGARELVERALRDMEAQPFGVKMVKDGKEYTQFIKGVVRQLPFGVYEFIFPDSAKDEVLTTLRFNENPYTFYGWKMKKAIDLMRRALCADKVPKFNTGKSYLWVIGSEYNVHIIPIGIRLDKDYNDPNGTRHEGL